MTEATDRKKLKISLIFSICFAVVIMATIILPNMMDLSGNNQMHFEGNPVYFCDEAFDINSCHNKTALKAGVFSNGGRNFMETDFKIMEFGNKTNEITVNATENLDIMDSLATNENTTDIEEFVSDYLDELELNMTKVPEPILNMTKIPILETETAPLTSGGMDLPPMPKDEEIPLSNQTETIEEPIPEEKLVPKDEPIPEKIKVPISNNTSISNQTVSSSSNSTS